MTAEEAIVAIQAAVAASADELYAMLAAAFRVARRIGPAVPLGEAYPTSAAFAAAVAAGDPDALGAALRALARRDGDAMLEPALALAAGARGELQRGAAFALSASRDDRALAVLLGGLDRKLPVAALADSVHPGLVAALRAAVAKSGILTFAPHAWPTRADLEAMSPVAYRAAIADTPMPAGGWRAKTALELLGYRRDAGSFETFATLFAGHPAREIRKAAAEALVALATPAAYALLDARRSDGDPLVESIVILAVLVRDLPTAWSRFASQIAAVRAGGADADAASRQLQMLLLHCRSADPASHPPPDRDPLLVEPRFVELAAELRADRRAGKAARRCLRAVPAEVARAAMDLHPLPASVAAPAVLPARRDYLARYLAGEYAAWTDLVAHADAIAQHADLHAEATAVATALMQRVRANTDAVRAGLRASGARLRAETPFDAVLFDRVVAAAGPAPLALEAFWRVCGSIALLPDQYDYGTTDLQREGISLLALDPLALGGVADIAYNLDDYTAEYGAVAAELREPLRLELAADFLHKQNISGGPPYAVDLPPASPAAALDPPILFTRREVTLVAYLRHAFRYGGFPLLEVAHTPFDQMHLNDRIGYANVKQSALIPAAADRLLARLRADLVAF